MGKLLFILACLIVPGLWGLLLSEIYLRCRRNRPDGKSPPSEGNAQSSQVERNSNGWSYHI
jgi:hypothetical protein